MPLAVALAFYRDRWSVAWGLLMIGMVVDLDHLFADPIYDPARCSLGTHALHKPLPILGYGVLTAVPRTRIVGLGLLIHMALDGLDCLI